MNKNVILQIQNDTTNEKYKFKIILQIQNIHTYMYHLTRNTHTDTDTNTDTDARTSSILPPHHWTPQSCNHNDNHNTTYEKMSLTLHKSYRTLKM